MNPLNSILGTIIAGFILAIIIAFVFDPNALNAWSLIVWFHVLAGITWIGLLYYFNFVQVPALGEATADSNGPGPAAIGKYVAPRALGMVSLGRTSDLVNRCCSITLRWRHYGELLLH